MSDEDLDRALRRYRVVDPDPALRRRIMAAAEGLDRSREGWWWGPASASAVLALWAAVTIAGVEQPGDPIRDAQVALAAEVLGGGSDALAIAELIVPAPPPQDSWPAIVEDPWAR